MNEKDAENLRDIITEIEEIAKSEPEISYYREYEGYIELVIAFKLKKERPPKHD